MSALTDDVLDFDKEDIDRLDQALRKFWDLRTHKDFPDWSSGEALYGPILSLVLLKAQGRVERLTLALVALSVALVGLTAALIATEVL